MLWERSYCNFNTDHPHYEIRPTSPMYAFVCIVATDNGYDYKYYKRHPKFFTQSTIGKNIHIAISGPMQMDFDEFEAFMRELKLEVDICKNKLKETTC